MQPYPTYFNQPGPQAAYPPPPEPRGRGARPYTGAKRGRKPRGGGPNTAAPTAHSDTPPLQLQPQSQQPQPQPQPQPGVHAYPVQPTSQAQQPQQPQPQPQQHAPPLHYYTPQSQSAMMPPPQYTPLSGVTAQKGKGKEEDGSSGSGLSLPTMPSGPTAFPMRYPTQQQPHARPVLALGSGSGTVQAGQFQMKLPVQNASAGGVAGVTGAVGTGAGASVGTGTGTGMGTGGADDEDDIDELPVMSDDVYGQGLAWQSQSKDNLKVLMDNFTPEQLERYEAYRRSALPKQAIRKAIQQSTNYTISQPVAQVVAGFAKVFVGEMVEKARLVQARMGEPPDTPLAPEHLREAYRLYQEETGKVGAARVHRGKRLFVR